MGTMAGQDLVTYDVVVVGGGAAGLSGALMLGRSRRSVLVVDAGEPRNAPAAGVHGFLTRDGIKPSALLEAGRAEVRGYGVEVLEGRVESAASTDDGFVATLEGGHRVGARQLLVTTGLVDQLPDIPGVRERWGRDLLHCPYCHRWEVRDQPIGILASGSMAVHQALLFRQLTADLTLFLHTTPQPTDEEAEQLAALGITVVEGEVASLEVREDRLTGVQLQDGEVVPRDAVVVSPRLAARAGILADLGLETTELPHGLGEYVESDATGLTAVPGVWVAGAVINADLVAEDTREAVAAHRDRLSLRPGVRMVAVRAPAGPS
jgi:thioredoxin reductase